VHIYTKLNKGEKTPPERKYTRAEDIEKMYRTRPIMPENKDAKICANSVLSCST